MLAAFYVMMSLPNVIATPGSYTDGYTTEWGEEIVISNSCTHGLVCVHYTHTTARATHSRMADQLHVRNAHERTIGGSFKKGLNKQVQYIGGEIMQWNKLNLFFDFIGSDWPAIGLYVICN